MGKAAIRNFLKELAITLTAAVVAGELTAAQAQLAAQEIMRARFSHEAIKPEEP
jgi:hypothetical protein